MPEPDPIRDDIQTIAQYAKTHADGDVREAADRVLEALADGKPLLVMGLYNPRRKTPPGVIDGRGEM